MAHTIKKSDCKARLKFLDRRADASALIGLRLRDCLATLHAATFERRYSNIRGALSSDAKSVGTGKLAHAHRHIQDKLNFCLSLSP